MLFSCNQGAGNHWISWCIPSAHDSWNQEWNLDLCWVHGQWLVLRFPLKIHFRHDTQDFMCVVFFYLRCTALALQWTFQLPGLYCPWISSMESMSITSFCPSHFSCSVDPGHRKTSTAWAVRILTKNKCAFVEPEVEDTLWERNWTEGPRSQNCDCDFPVWSPWPKAVKATFDKNWRVLEKRMIGFLIFFFSTTNPSFTHLRITVLPYAGYKSDFQNDPLTNSNENKEQGCKCSLHADHHRLPNKTTKAKENKKQPTCKSCPGFCNEKMETWISLCPILSCELKHICRKWNLDFWDQNQRTI